MTHKSDFMHSHYCNAQRLRTMVSDALSLERYDQHVVINPFEMSPPI